MPRRVNRHLFTPPLPQRAGIDPVSLTLPAHPVLHETTQGPDAHPNTVAQYLITRFSPEDPATILDCFARHEVRTDEGTILTDQSPYLPGLRIWYYRPLPEEPPLPDDLPVLYEDEHLLAVDKPHYLPVTPRGAYVAQTALTKLRVRENNPLLTPVHRLDRPTAGILLFAKTREARGPFQTMFQNRQVTKTYLAIAPAPSEDLRESMLGEGVQVRSRIDKDRNILQVRQYSARECERAGLTMNAETLVRIREIYQAPQSVPLKSGAQNPYLPSPAPGEEVALYELTPHTGKMHQLRAHLNLLGTPIFGDVLYPQVLPTAPNDASVPLQLLAHRLDCVHPFTNKPLTLYSARTLSLAPRNVVRPKYQ